MRIAPVAKGLLAKPLRGSVFNRTFFIGANLVLLN
jgi:hypothetical protein